MAYTFVQKKTGTGNGVTSVTLTLPNPTTVGNQLIAFTSAVTFPNATFTSSLSDSNSNTWRNDKTVTFLNGANLHCLSAIDQTILATAGSGHTVTFTSTDAGNTFYEVAVVEFSNASNTIDQSASQTAVTNTTTITATTPATTNANDLLVACFASNGSLGANGQNSPANVNGSQTGVVSIYSVADDSTITGIEASYSILSSTGAQAVNYTYTADSGGGYGLAVVAYEAFAPPPPPPPRAPFGPMPKLVYILP